MKIKKKKFKKKDYWVNGCVITPKLTVEDLTKKSKKKEEKKGN